MKRLTGVLLLIMATEVGRSQSFGEWFQQKKTQIRYLEQQIAALEALIAVTEKGYEETGRLTDKIEQAQEGDFSLHTAYLNALRSPSPSAARYNRITRIFEYQAAIVELTKEIRGVVQYGRNPTVTRWAELVLSLCDGMLNSCSEDLDILDMLTTNGVLSMSDSDRVEALDVLVARMQRRYNDAVQARNELALLKIQ